MPTQNATWHHSVGVPASAVKSQQPIGGLLMVTAPFVGAGAGYLIGGVWGKRVAGAAVGGLVGVAATASLLLLAGGMH